MDQIGSNWIRLDSRVDQSGSDWIRLDQIESHWIKLDQCRSSIGSDWINAGQGCWREMLGESMYFQTNDMDHRIRLDHIGPTQLRLADTKCSVNQRTQRFLPFRLK